MARPSYVLFVLALSTLWLRADPAVPASGLYKPTFLLLNDSWSAGTAFIVTAPGFSTPLLVTCNHLFGPDGGLQNQMSPDDIANEVHGAVGLSMQDKSSILTAPSYLKVTDAQTIDNDHPDKDLALFAVASSKNLTTFTLSDALPGKGERVWMYARLRGTDEPKLYPATVIEDGTPHFEYVFDDSTLVLGGTSGAPILNEKGLVVGMNLGGGTTADKKLFGIANPAPSILKEIGTVTKP